jgi:hypothetical protein
MLSHYEAGADLPPVCDDGLLRLDSPSTLRSTSTHSHRRIVFAAVGNPDVASATALIEFCTLQLVLDVAFSRRHNV